jgi:hypothetical protein
VSFVANPSNKFWDMTALEFAIACLWLAGMIAWAAAEWNICRQLTLADSYAETVRIGRSSPTIGFLGPAWAIAGFVWLLIRDLSAKSSRNKKTATPSL